ncbi:MAG: S8 family serine peptidase [Bacteroidota bacterium]
MFPRSLTLFFAFVLLTSGMSAQSYYWTDAGPATLTESTVDYIIHTSEGALDHLNGQAVVEGFSEIKAFTNKQFAIVKTKSSDMKGDKMLDALGIASTEMVAMSPAYLLEDGFPLYLTSRIVFQPSGSASLGQIEQILGAYGYTSLTEQYGVYRVEMSQLSDVLAAANKLQESGLTTFSHPDFYAPKNNNNDPLFSQQFQMNNTGQTIDGVTGANDADCNALEAWGITLGSSGITVAIIDDGMENHEDMNDASGASRLVGGFTPASGGNGGTTSGSNHGQACGGIVGASHNNIGVRGVAPLVRMLTVNIFFGGETTQDIADGISWAKNNGADVLSNSWGYTSCSASFSNINNAISDATNNGRGGLGCVVVFASGNGYKSCVDFPANNSNVIAVGAFTNQGVRSSYSNYGSALDIVAPSNAVSPQPGAGVRTTDRMGGAGYASGNYTNNFGGTSAACPVVAGVAALVLGYNPNLTEAEVKNILYSTAIDMGSPGFDTQYANGRVNAFAALQAAGGQQATCTDGIQNGQETGVDCGGPDCPPCQTGCNDNDLTLTITLDNYPEETSWNITNSGGSTVASGGTYGSQPDGSTITEDICLPNDCYTFTILDSYGDGICCAYGNGSYSLNQGSTVLASGGSFGSSEATNFCLGAPDSQPPTTPGNLSASNTTQTSTDLSWSPSSDNIGVIGYNVYVDNVLNGTSTTTDYSVAGLTASTTYSMSVGAVDAAGNESTRASINVTTADPVGGGGTQTVFAHFFESGWDGWQDGGSDCFRYSGGRSWEGNYSIRIRDNSGVASSMTSPSYNLSSFNSVELKFYFYPNSMETGEDFWVRYNDGSGWQTIATYASGTSFQNDQFYSATIILDDATYNLSSNASFRIQCDASANADRVYIDEVTLVGTLPGGNNVISSTSRNDKNTIELLQKASNAGMEFYDEDVLVMPNPTADLITVRSEDPMTRISVLNLDGKLLLERSVDSLQEQVQLGDLPAGIYLISITTEDDIINKRVVKH